MKKITIYCGSKKGTNSVYEAGARALVQEMIARDHSLVYGAGRVGLMGVIADEMLAAGKEVLGIIPQKLVDREVAHTGCTELIIVETMRDRKWLMATIPFVILGIMRYAQMIYLNQTGEQPEKILISDRLLLLTILGWGITVITLVYVS